MILALVMCPNVWGEEETLDVRVQSRQEAPLKLLIGIIGAENSSVRTVAQTIKNDIEFEGHFAVDCKMFSHLTTLSQMQALASEGYPIALFIQEGVKDNHSVIDWHIYDTQQASMLAAKRHVKVGSLPRGWAHEVADSVFQVLLSKESSFSSRIAYCKNVHIQGKRAVRHICVADFDGGNVQSVVKKSTLNIMPRWNTDAQRPLLFYSEGTDKNFRLIVNDLHGHSWVASNLDGLNMLPAFSSDGKQVVYCASRGAGSCQLYLYTKNKLKRLTHNDGNNISPTMSADGSRVYFCSDYQGGKPAIYCYHIHDGTIERITKGGAAFSPSYHDAKRQLVYVQSVKGVLQVCLYDEKLNTHKQLTFDEGSKEECSWSPCGTYILYGVEQGGKGRIAMLNVVNKRQFFITDKDEDCSYPAWSPRYAHYPVVVG